MRERYALIVGGVLMFLLGLARGAGGVILLIKGPAADPGIHAGGPAVAVVALILTVLGAGLVAAAVGVLRAASRAWRWGIGLVVAFVLDGAVNGAVLYGRPGDAGTAVNVLAALLILLFLFLGRKRLNRNPHGTPGGV
jgi:hypothetical protein